MREDKPDPNVVVVAVVFSDDDALADLKTVSAATYLSAATNYDDSEGAAAIV